MHVAQALLDRARAARSRSLAVVGTSKNAGKSVVVAALADAFAVKGATFGLTSIGRDGEAIDAVLSTPKPRFFLRPGAVFATAHALIPQSPACEVLDVLQARSALGPIVIARARVAGFIEIAGPPSARAVRHVVERLATYAPFVVIDGAVDRIAALRDGDDAIVVAVGAATAQTVDQAADDAAALVMRLRLPVVDLQHPSLAIEGALTIARASALIRAAERRQVVVADATQIAINGRAFLQVSARLALRCERAMHPIACTVAPLWLERSFEPAAFAHAVARRTGLPTYDVYGDREVLPEVA